MHKGTKQLCKDVMQGAAHDRLWSMSRSQEKGSLLVQSTQFNSKTQNAISNLHTGRRHDKFYGILQSTRRTDSKTLRGKNKAWGEKSREMRLAQDAVIRLDLAAFSNSWATGTPLEILPTKQSPFKTIRAQPHSIPKTDPTFEAHSRCFENMTYKTEVLRDDGNVIFKK